MSTDYARRGFDMLFDTVSRAHEAQRKVVPLRPAVDLRVQLERALTEIEDAAALLDVHYPFTAKAKRRTAQQIRNLVQGA